tara:strand:+ start:327 stop:1409 length:1083 start_codon:yes stop_codon:yes gene_type:complete
MASVDFHQKISGHEAKEWIRNVCDAMDRGATFDDEESFINFISEQKPKDFKAPRKQRASKKSSEDRAATEYNCQLCDARVWNSGLGGQCSRKKIDGEWCCTIHFKEAAKNDGKLRNGLITEERPTHAYGDESQALLPWHDVELPKKTKKTSGGEGKGKGKGARKCSNCGECGHNKKTCPLLKCETVDKVDKVEKNVEKKVEEVEKVEDVISTVRAALTEVVAKVEETHDEPIPEDDAVVSKVEETIEEPVPEDDGAGTGLIPLKKEQVEEPTAVRPVLMLVEEKVDTPKTEPLSDEELEEDQSGDTITFQGIEYTLDTEENMVYDDELAEVGTWDGEKIEFINATAAKLHRVRKLACKGD